MKESKNKSAKVTTEFLQAQIAELTEALQRERADSANIRRRHDEQIGSLKDMVRASVVRELLPVIDNFERALQHLPEQNEESGIKNKEWLKGIESIKSQFDKTLEKMGVQRIKTLGEVFDPRLHEAVSMEESDGTIEVVSEELQAGYTLGDEVIRHAMVRVKREKAK